MLLEQLSRFQNGEQLWIQIVMEAGGQEWKDQAETYIKEQYGQKPKAKEGFFDLLLKAIIWLPSQVIQALTTDQINLSALFGYGPAEVKKDEKPPSLTILQKNKVEAVAAKAQKIGLHCKIRVLYFGKTSVFRKRWRVSMIKAIFQQYTKQDTNNFTLDKDVTPQDDYFWLKLSYDRRTNRLVQAYKNRDFAIGAPSCVLNTEELATIYHFPTIDIKAPSVKKTESRRAEPPVGLPMAMEGEPDLPERPSPLIPFGQEDENASAFDIFEESAQMSPIISLPPLQAKREETVFAWEQPQQKKEFSPESPSAKEESLSIDLPPLAGQTKSVKAIPSPISLPTPPQEKKISIPKRRIPDAMRVLLEPGVELEDVGLSDMASDETDDSPKNLPL